MSDRVMFPTGEAVTGKSLAPELDRIRTKTPEHASRWAPHFPTETYEMPGGPADKEEAAMTAACAPMKSPRRKKK